MTLRIDPVLSYSTFLGGVYIDIGGGIAIDEQGNAYITGQTNSNNFPTTGVSISCSLLSDASHGTALVKEDGIWTYTPKNNTL